MTGSRTCPGGSETSAGPVSRRARRDAPPSPIIAPITTLVFRWRLAHVNRRRTRNRSSRLVHHLSQPGASQLGDDDHAEHALVLVDRGGLDPVLVARRNLSHKAASFASIITAALAAFSPAWASEITRLGAGQATGLPGWRRNTVQNGPSLGATDGEAEHPTAPVGGHAGGLPRRRLPAAARSAADRRRWDGRSATARSASRSCVASH